MPDDKTQALAEAFVLGTLERTEADAFARRLAQGDPLALETFDEISRLAVALPHTLPQHTPPLQLKQRLLSRVAAEAGRDIAGSTAAKSATVRAMPQRTFVQSLKRSLAWAAVFLLFALGLAYVNQRKVIGTLAQERDKLQQQVAEMQKQNEALQLRLALHAAIERTIQKPKAKVVLVDLGSAKPESNIAGTVVFDKEELKAYFVSDKLPALAATQDYQLWYIGKSGPVDAGILPIAQEGRARAQLSNLPSRPEDIAAFALSLEPKGGSRTPTEVLLVGRV